MIYSAKKDPMLETVKQLIIESKNPSMSHVQRSLKLGYTRVKSLLEAMEGEIVTVKDASGWRSMLTGETNGRD